ncbi:hypothetical protein CEE45_11775 [Candidatus Heimdallarchaeota archaeon B3_Heim]|nr:MAG: hypothetical protein CEE45_11775 [Candidatus Heimdallarchaeota archaeon B3_Heim]
MSFIADFVDLLFSFYFYVFIWILLLILTFLLIRKLLQDYKYQKILKNSIGLIESENKKIPLSENRFYLDQAGQFLDKLFKKGQSEIKDQSLENSPLFQKIFAEIKDSISEKNSFCIISTESLIEEGFDLPELVREHTLNGVAPVRSLWVAGLIFEPQNRNDQSPRRASRRLGCGYITCDRRRICPCQSGQE